MATQEAEFDRVEAEYPKQNLKQNSQNVYAPSISQAVAK
jgi:hypothetical protein